MEKGQISSRVTITSLPSHVLLDVFDFYRLLLWNQWDEVWKWQTLAHVCSRWRQIVFESPRRLDLRLTCTGRKIVREMLDAFPNFPININYQHNPQSLHDTREYLNNILAALECRGQARRISLTGRLNPLLKTLVTRMQEPFPALTSLELMSNDGVETAPVIPDTFLGRSAPSLQSLNLGGISFPGLPNLLFSARDLVSLKLTQIPISPEALADNLSALPRLTSFILHSATSHSDRTIRRPPPLTGTIVPSLTSFTFYGAIKYLEDLVAPISAPLLEFAAINLDQPSFVTPQLFRFLSRSEILKSLKRLGIRFEQNLIQIASFPSATTPRPGYLTLRVVCQESAWRVTLAAQLCSQSSPLFSEVEKLEINGIGGYQSIRQDHINQIQWLEVFRPFTAVQKLHISDYMMPLFLPALRGLAEEEAKELLPALHSLVFTLLQPNEYMSDVIRSFSTARRFFGRPVGVYFWN